jgi:MOSC domain-containing protein YiiM
VYTIRRLPTVREQILRPKLGHFRTALLRQPASRAQYYAGLARVLDPGNIPEGDLIAIEDRVKIRTIQRAVFAEQEVALYD